MQRPFQISFRASFKLEKKQELDLRQIKYTMKYVCDQRVAIAYTRVPESLLLI